jgi:hypothetical protein
MSDLTLMLLQSAGQALIQAMTSDTWAFTRDRLVTLLAGGDPVDGSRLADDLDSSRRAVERHHDERALEERRWQGRLERMVAGRPDLAEELVRLLPSQNATQSASPLHQSAVNSGSGTVSQNHNSHNRSTTVKIGGAVTLLLLLAAVAVWFVSRDEAPAAPARTPGAVTLDLSPTSGPRGTQVRVAAAGFAPGERVKILAHVTQVGRVAADGNGEIAAAFVMPADAMAIQGQVMIQVVGEQSQNGQNQAFTLIG